MKTLITNNYKILLLMINFILLFSTSNVIAINSNEEWKLLGPGDADQVTSLTVRKSGDVFLGTDIGGIYHSADFGRHWEPVNNGLKNLDITTPVLVDESSQNTLLVGTRGGLYKTVDGAASWKNIRKGLPSLKKSSLSGSVGSIEQDSFNHSRFYLGMGYRPSSAGNSTISKLKWLNHIYVSNDKGESWYMLPSFGNKQKVNQIVSSEIESDVVYVAADEGIYKSSNAGMHWKQIYTGQILNLLEFKDKPNLLIASAGINGVIKSEDNGLTWKKINRGLSFGNFSNKKTNRYSVLAASSVEPGVIYLTNSTWSGPGGLYKSTNYGENWQKITDKLPESWLRTSRRMNAVAVGPNNKLYLGSSRYIYRSDDVGKTWLQLISKKYDGGWKHTGINIFGHTRVAKPVPNNNKLIYIGTADHGILRSINGGESWNPIGTSLDYADNVWDIDVCTKQPDSLYIISSNIKGKLCMYTSSNKGDTWQSHCDNLGKSNRNEKIYVEPKSCTVTYITTSKGLFRGDNTLGNWHTIFDHKDIIVNDFSFAPTASQLIYIATNKGVYKSTDKGSNWKTLPSLKGKKIESIHVSLKNPNVIFAGSSISYNNKAAIYRSQDAGKSWEIVKPVHGKYVSSFTQIMKKPDVLYASINDYNYHDVYIDAGVYKSVDHGMTWAPVYEVLPRLRAFNVSSSNSPDAKVYLSVQGGGVYVRSESGD